jgi:hypothetical protein
MDGTALEERIILGAAELATVVGSRFKRVIQVWLSTEMTSTHASMNAASAIASATFASRSARASRQSSGSTTNLMVVAGRGSFGSGCPTDAEPCG